MMHLNVIYFSISVCPALSYAVEKVESMLEAADVLKSSGKELLALVPKDSKFGDVSNKIQNAIYWVNASLKSLCPFNGHAAEVPVSDFDIPQFGEPCFMQQQQQEQQQQEPTSTKCHVPAAAAGSSEQEATDVLIVDDPEISDPKPHKKFQKVLPDPCNKGIDLYKDYHCYFVNIKDPRYNTKRGAPTRFVPDDTICHCGESFDSPGKVAQHVSQQHPSNSIWTCFICGSTSTKREYIWKHVRTQHLNLYVHMCQFKNCNKGKNGQKFGNDEITVWSHMEMKHGLKNPLACPFCQRTFSGKAAQMSHINGCEELKPPRRTKDFLCLRPQCGKKYVDETSLATHIADHDGKIIHPVCAYCGKTFANSSSLQLHIRNTCQSVPTDESPKKKKKSK